MTQDVGSTQRKSMTKARRLRIFEAHSGTCVLCKAKIDGVREKWTVEHIIALGLSGADDDANCGPAHEDCRRMKDKEDVPAIAKAKRIKERHIGITAPKQKIKSPGFPVSEKVAQRVSKPPLPSRPLYQPASTGSLPTRDR